MDNIKNIFAPILVVEDNSDHALIIINSLKENRNFMNEIIHMKNGRDATQFLKKEGKYKMCGKEYVVEDGDIIFFKFNKK